MDHDVLERIEKKLDKQADAIAQLSTRLAVLEDYRDRIKDHGNRIQALEISHSEQRVKIGVWSGIVSIVTSLAYMFLRNK